MSPSVLMLLVRNFKFLTEGSLERTRNYRFCEKEIAVCFRDKFPERFSSMGLDFSPPNERSLTGLVDFELATDVSTRHFISFSPVQTPRQSINQIEPSPGKGAT